VDLNLPAEVAMLVLAELRLTMPVRRVVRNLKLERLQCEQE